MNKVAFYITAIVFVTGCRLQADSSKEYGNDDPSKTYKLQVSPKPGSDYHYDINKETEISFEVDEKNIENINRSDIGTNYKIDKDSAGNLLFTLQFDKIHLYSKNNGQEKERNADNGILSLDPIEKMLAILKETNLQSTVTPAGETKVISGFKEIGDKIMAAFPQTDENTKMAIDVQLNKTIGDNLVKKNLDQLFKIFPDSSVHIGDTWKLISKQEAEVSYTVQNIFTLKAINNDIAIIQSHGTVTSENAVSNISGIGSSVVSGLKGETKGEYEVETQTGMTIRSRSKSDVEGTIQVMGRQIPIKLRSSIEIRGKRVSS